MTIAIGGRGVCAPVGVAEEPPLPPDGLHWELLLAAAGREPQKTSEQRKSKEKVRQSTSTELWPLGGGICSGLQWSR